MAHPDFAVTDVTALTPTDIAFLLSRFPGAATPGPGAAGTSGAASTSGAAGTPSAAGVPGAAGLPDTAESMLASAWAAQAVLEADAPLTQVSPFLLFSVLLRRTLGAVRTRDERRVVNYLANLLTLYLHAHRLHRPSADAQEEYRYLYQLVAAAAQARADDEFPLHVQLANYALFLAGVFPQWIEHRHRYAHRPVGRDYYVNLGRAHFGQAAGTRAASRCGIADVLATLGSRFEDYAGALSRMTQSYLPGLAH